MEKSQPNPQSALPTARLCPDQIAIAKSACSRHWPSAKEVNDVTASGCLLSRRRYCNLHSRNVRALFMRAGALLDTNPRIWIRLFRETPTTGSR